MSLVTSHLTSSSSIDMETFSDSLRTWSRLAAALKTCPFELGELTEVLGDRLGVTVPLSWPLLGRWFICASFSTEAICGVEVPLVVAASVISSSSTSSRVSRTPETDKAGSERSSSFVGDEG
jgi:hypothetical protein